MSLAAVTVIWLGATTSGCLALRTAETERWPEAAPFAAAAATNALPKTKHVVAGAALALTLSYVSEGGTRLEQNCELSLREKSSGTTWRARLVPGKSALVIELPAGSYAPIELACSVQSFDLSNWRDRFVVREGKVSYGGHLEIGSSPGQLLTVGLKVGARGEADALGALFEHAAGEGRAALVSSFVSSWTGKRITGEMLRERPYQGFEYTWKTASKLVDPAGLVSQMKDHMKSCETDELARNRVWLGRLKVTAFYLKGRIASTIVEDLPNTYSELFIDCVRSGLAGFSAGSSEPFSITVAI